MSKQWQIRRGTTAENNEFTGAQGELTMDTDTGALRVHDGITQGGKGFVDTVIEFQAPTAENGYTWYRKYSSGWVEQGGFLANSVNGVVIFLPVVMNNIYYNINIQSRLDAYGTATNIGSAGNISTTSFTHFHYGDTSQSWSWFVSGIAA